MVRSDPLVANSACGLKEGRRSMHHVMVAPRSTNQNRFGLETKSSLGMTNQTN